MGVVGGGGQVKLMLGCNGISGLYYKHVMIINYVSISVNKLRASLNDDARVVIYDCHMFILQATGMILYHKAKQ